MPRLTDEEKEIVSQRYVAGETIEQLALDLGRVPLTISNALRALQVQIRQPGSKGERKPDPKRDTEGKRGTSDPTGRIAKPSVARRLR